MQSVALFTYMPSLPGRYRQILYNAEGGGLIIFARIIIVATYHGDNTLMSMGPGQRN